MINLKHYLKEGFVLIGTVWLLMQTACFACY